MSVMKHTDTHAHCSSDESKDTFAGSVDLFCLLFCSVICPEDNVALALVAELSILIVRADRDRVASPLADGHERARSIKSNSFDLVDVDFRSLRQNGP